MLATVHCDSLSLNSLPVCLRSENSNRLVSLLDIVKSLNLGLLAGSIQQLERIWLDASITAAQAPARVDAELTDRAGGIIDAIKRHSDECGFEECSQDCGLSLIVFQRDRLNATLIENELNHVRNSLLKELISRQFVPISKDRTDYAENRALFGDCVKSAFPSADSDIRECGNCLTVETWSAAVFHLMRAVEHGLRALARDRRIALPKKAVLDLATWETIIRELEKTEIAIQGYPATLAREAQFEFYHGAMMEFKRFKNKFRNRIMHTREDYDRDEAHSAFTHVRAFMQILATRIAEKKRTPLIWKGKKWTTIKP